MNPVGHKIQKVKKSFRPEIHLTSESTLTDVRSQDALYDSASLNNLHDPFILDKASQPIIEDEVFQTNALLQRILTLQDRVDRQERSIIFYLRELNRREHHHQQQLSNVEKQQAERVECLERLLQMEVDKNIALERQLGRVSRCSCEDKENIEQYRRNQLKKMTMAELGQIVNCVQDQVDSRKQKKESIDRKEQNRTPLRQEQRMIRSLTEDSALLSDYKDSIK